MHPEFSQMALHDHQLELDRRTRAAFAAHQQPGVEEHEEVVALRLCTVADDAALERLAILEGRPAPAGRYVVAELDGEVVAAVSLVTGAVLADPFRRTVQLRPLLALRAGQLAPEARRSRGLPLWSTVRAWGRASA